MHSFKWRKDKKNPTKLQTPYETIADKQRTLHKNCGKAGLKSRPEVAQMRDSHYLCIDLIMMFTVRNER